MKFAVNIKGIVTVKNEQEAAKAVAELKSLLAGPTAKVVLMSRGISLEGVVIDPPKKLS